MTHDPRVDDLRQRLRSLGYLDAGVDRFVLGSARTTRPPYAIALLASLRIGALAAVLLGPAAAIGLSARLPTLVTGPTDALVVALYLGAFFGLALGATAFAVCMIAAWTARGSGGASSTRESRLPRIAGIAVTLLTLVYLTLWWQTVIAGVGWSAPMWTISALVIAVAISLLLGHAVMVGASAVVIASARATESGRAGALRIARSSWRSSLASGGVAFAAAALLLTWAGEARFDSSGSSPRLTVVPSGLRIRVIAIDGFDPRIFQELSAAGRTPALRSIFADAVVSLRSSDGEPADPARTWTTVATGQPAAVHGVEGLERRGVAGLQGSVPAAETSPVGRALRGATDLVRLTRPVIASGSERRAKTFWEVAAEAGLRTTVVNWWATWPAGPLSNDAGIVLSDRATLRLEHGGQLDAELSSEELYTSLRQRWPEIKTRAATLAREALPELVDGPTRGLLQRSAELDAIQLALLSEVIEPTTDLAVVYLPGLDIAQHALLGDARGGSGDDQGRIAASTLAERLDSLRQYYVALDHLLAPSLTVDRDELVIVITQPGRVSAEASARIIARGKVIRATARLEGDSTQLAPTVLHALGVPIGRDLAGAPLLELFDRQFVDRYPVRFVAGYGRPMPKSLPREGQPLDREMIERLRSLGYVR